MSGAVRPALNLAWHDVKPFILEGSEGNENYNLHSQKTQKIQG